ncbi:MAG: serpin family protein, partial [Planctomycetota bacterium]
MRVIAGIIALAVAVNAASQTPAVEKADEAKKTDREIVVHGNNEFALALYAKLRSAEGNLFFSPYSISTALAMTYVGARGPTESQMARVLHFPTDVAMAEEPALVPLSDRRRFASVFGEIIKDLNNRGKKGRYKLAVANALWAQKDYGILGEFLELTKTGFDGKLQEVDFVKASETARKTINSWVEEKTNEKIKDLISKGVLDSMTRLVLTNA